MWETVETTFFLLTYDRKQDQLLSCEEFVDPTVAMAAYEQAENDAWGNRALDIVLVGANSIEAVKVTHANYFTGNAKRLVREALQLQ